HPTHADRLPLHSFPTRRSSDLKLPIRAIVVAFSRSSSNFFLSVISETMAIVPRYSPSSSYILFDDIVVQTGAPAFVKNCISNCLDRKSTRLNSSHVKRSSAVYC